MTEHLDPDEAARVLRRAAELGAHGDLGAGYDRGALTEAAAEVGIDRQAVRRALAEHDAGVLAPASGPPGLLGVSRVVVARTVPLGPTAARARTQRWLQRQMLERGERHQGRETWRRRSDLAAKVKRKFDPTRRVRLGNVDAVHLSVADAGDGRSVVRLEADLDDMRRGLLTGVVLAPAAVTPVLGAAAAGLTGDLFFVFGAVPLGATLGGLGVVGGRRTLGHERDDAARNFALFLDELEGR